MGGFSTPKVAPTPPEPETVKRTEAEVARLRSDAKAVAARRYGMSGTNITRNRLQDEAIEDKKKTLGGM